ncbi:MAG: N-acetylmuramoyl-L-alanine amidase [Candidatus Omnitrophota bacterium]
MTLKIFAVIALLLVPLAGCMSVPVEQQTDIPLAYLAEQAQVQVDYDPVTRRVKMRRGDWEASMIVGASTVWAGDGKVLLNAPVEMRGDEILVPYDFKEKVFWPFLASTYRQRLPGHFRVVIDAGHGGKDPGALGQGLQEKVIVLDIARRLARELELLGFSVILTRSTDEFISLERRTEIASSSAADLFISLHANASKSSRACGFEIWTPRVLTYEDKQEAQRVRNHELLYDKLSVDRQNRSAQLIVEDLLYRYKEKASLTVGKYMLSAVMTRSRQRNRGLKRSGFFVLRNTLIPSVLVEVGFVTNNQEARELNSISFRQDLAESLAESVSKYAETL